MEKLHGFPVYLLISLYARIVRPSIVGVPSHPSYYGYIVFIFSGEWKVFSGNETGALLGWWIFTCWKNQKQDPSAIKDVYMLSSTVSSKILRAIALKEGFHFEVNCCVESHVFSLCSFVVDLTSAFLGYCYRKLWLGSNGWEIEPSNLWTRGKLFCLLLKRQ